ncbi:MAG: hypothetical protein OSJ43_09800, partial [Oscillospiraceae bacterium]|nr:hypothetical protein [Oscillospiraceae bacterium]
ETVAEPEPEPAPVEDKPAGGGKMSQDDIEKMLAAASAPEPENVAEPEPEPAPVEDKPASGGKMSQDDIEKLLAAAGGTVDDTVNNVAEAVRETLDSAPSAAAEPAPVEEKSTETSGGGKMSQADIEALLNGMKEDATT